MSEELIAHPGPPERAWRARAVTRGIATLAGVTALSLGAPLVQMASAQAADTHGSSATTQRALVVKTAQRTGFGTILVTVKGRALYRDSSDGPNHPTCTVANGCASVWPPLLMPIDKTIPTGIAGLGTVKLPSGRLQVTVHKEPLYTFSGDSGTSVNGNGIGPFLVVHP